MAKKCKKKDEEVVANCDHLDEPVTNCDQSKELVANHDQLDDVVEISSAEDIDIAKLIVVVRGQQVLIDRDIAMLYKVETRTLNQKVKRNVARFPERFRFQLTKQELQELITNCDRFETMKHVPSPPYAFTEQGTSPETILQLLK
ncbi:MAG: ORF6N domain-containing protein [Prevotella sp.]|nr:ORF6N domain-containing protein [Prevotella sp.]